MAPTLNRARPAPRWANASFRLGAGLALLVASLSTAACDLACAEVGCERDGLRVSATRADGHPLAAGKYVIELQADEDLFRAECNLEELATDRCELRSMMGEPEGDASLSIAGDDAPRDIRIDLRRAEATTRNIDLTGPTSVTVAISLDGTSIASESLLPTYERDEPNGPQCGACEHSEYYVDLLPPTAKN